MFYETSFDLKQPKLELKPVSTLSETRYLFQLFRSNIETTYCGVLIKPKQKKNRPKQTKKEEVSKNLLNADIVFPKKLRQTNNEATLGTI
jgi:hypothetical protein